MGRMDDRQTLNAYARLVGFLYVAIIIVSLGGTRLVAAYHGGGDFVQTSANVRAAETFYRTGLALELTSAALIILLAGATYVLLRSVDRNLALFALLWRVGEATLGAVFIVFSFVALSVYTGRASGFEIEEQELLVVLLQDARRAAFGFATLYFSLGSILIFYLLLRSRFIPQILAAAGLIASVSVTLLGYGYMLAPQQVLALGLAAWLPILTAELATGLWLLIKGLDLSYVESRPQGNHWRWPNA